MKIVIAFPLLFVSVLAFGGSEDRFIKKYAMMKIYESCFGPEVVKQIRKEMKAASIKCAAFENTLPPVSTSPMLPIHQQQPAQSDENSGENHVPEANHVPSPNPQQVAFDVEKLNQAIFAFRPNPQYSQPQAYRPYGPSAGASSFYSPPFANPGYQVNPLYYQGYQQQMPYLPYSFPMVGQQFYGNRMSRDMDIKSQLEALTNRMSGKVRNVTCVMQELGYLDDNLEPNFEKISQRISYLPVSEELKRDMQDGVNFCQQFSQCVPEVKKEKSPLSRELIRPMFFFKCYKHKKLEACIMKDVREKYSGVTDDDFDGDVELRRQGKSSKVGENNEDEIDNLATSVYEFLYASDSNFDIDSIL